MIYDLLKAQHREDNKGSKYSDPLIITPELYTALMYDLPILFSMIFTTLVPPRVWVAA